MTNDTTKCSRWVVLSSLAFLAGCSSFNQQWNAAPAATGPGDISGKWVGHWRSEKDDHTGQLKCVVTRLGDTQYRAYFVATYWKLFTFAYQAELKGQIDNQTVHLTGQEDLGALAGGVYTYDGRADNHDFNCKYSSKYDHGVFVLTRPDGSK